MNNIERNQKKWLINDETQKLFLVFKKTFNISPQKCIYTHTFIYMKNKYSKPQSYLL